MTLRLLVADDEADIRLLLVLTLGQGYGFEVVAEAADGLEAAKLAAAHRPDVVVLDWKMPGVNGLEAVPLIRRDSPRSRILMYSALPSGQAAEQALAAGADCYLGKTEGTRALVSAIGRLGVEAAGPGL